MRSARARRFGIARKWKVAQTASIETIEYKSLTEWRTGGEVRGFANKRGLPFEVSRATPQQEERGLGNETTTNSGPHLRRTLTLRDLILYGVIVIQPVAPMSVFGVLSERGKGHVVTAILIAMVAMLFTGIDRKSVV